jgi:hypothetical protein
MPRIGDSQCQVQPWRDGPMTNADRVACLLTMRDVEIPNIEKVMCRVWR